jgi:hypothetical protein
MSNFAYQVSNKAYQGDGASRAYQGNSVLLIDTHDGFDGKRKYYQNRIEARERLRTQLEEAFASPTRLARKPVTITHEIPNEITKILVDDDEDWLLLIQ